VFSLFSLPTSFKSITMKNSNRVSVQLLKEILTGFSEEEFNRLESGFNELTLGEDTCVDKAFTDYVEDALDNWHPCDVCGTSYSYDEPCEFH